MGGGISEGRVVQPTIIELADHAARPAREEMFGPILAVHHRRQPQGGHRHRQRHPIRPRRLGLHRQRQAALRAARALRAGTVTVNSFGEGDITTPFGGYRQSGFGGRDNSVHAHDQYTQLKTIWLDLSERGKPLTVTDLPLPRPNLAVTTPFDGQGRVDLAALEDHLERYIAAGVDGFVLSSGTGMHVYLSRKEFRRAGGARARRSSPAAPRSSCRPRRCWSRTWSRGPATPPTGAPTASWCCRRSSRDRPTTTASSPSMRPRPRAVCRSSAITCPRPSASASRRRYSASSAQIPNFCTAKDSAATSLSKPT